MLKESLGQNSRMQQKIEEASKIQSNKMKLTLPFLYFLAIILALKKSVIRKDWKKSDCVNRVESFVTERGCIL